MSYLPHRNAPGLERELVSYYQDWLDHPTYDEYWKSIDATQKASAVSAPTLDITGWQDLFSRGHIDMYNALQESGKDIPKNEQRLLIGPWAHESYMGYANDRVGDKVFGPIASSAAGFVGPFTPALAIRPCRIPKFLMVSSVAEATLSSFDTSTLTQCEKMESVNMLEESKSQPETYAPSSESLRLIARPIPFAAPVTINFRIVLIQRVP